MGYGSAEYLWPQSGDAAWSAWCQSIYDLLVTTCGLTNTADTGSTALPVSSTYPTANNFSVWWVFRFNDSMQGSAPIYFKLELARGTGTANARIQVTAGTGTNGSGTITGVVLPATSIGVSNWTPSSTNPTRFEACYNTATGCFWMVAEPNTTNTVSFFMINRTLDSGGTPSADGWAVQYYATSGSPTRAVREVAAAVTRTPTGFHAMPAGVISGSVTSQAHNGKNYLYPPTMWATTALKQLGGYYGVAKAGFAVGSTWSINQFGTAHTYKCVGQATSCPHQTDFGSSSGSGPLLIWE